MTARGPDGHGEWFSDNGRVAFGHRRLAIIDLSDRAAQPMASADGQLVNTLWERRPRRECIQSNRGTQGHSLELAAMDQPSIDGVTTWFVKKAPASQGIKVTALSGLGGDELSASYPSFAELPLITSH